MDVSAIVHVPVGLVAGAFGWLRSQLDVRGRERTVALREQTVTQRTDRLAELETAERNLANQRWNGLEVEVPHIVTAYWRAGRMDLTLNYTIRNRRAIGAFFETVQGSITWPTGDVTTLAATRVDQQLSAGTAHTFSRQIQWVVAEGQLEWLTGPPKQVPDVSTGAVRMVETSKRIALVDCSVGLEIFARIGTESVRIELPNQPVELLVSNSGSSTGVI